MSCYNKENAVQYWLQSAAPRWCCYCCWLYSGVSIRACTSGKRDAKWWSGQTEYSFSPHCHVWLNTSYPCIHYIPHHPRKAKKEEKHFRENEATCPKLKNRGLLFSRDGEIVCCQCCQHSGALYLKSTHISKMNMFSPCKQKLVRHVRLWAQL